VRGKERIVKGKLSSNVTLKDAKRKENLGKISQNKKKLLREEAKILGGRMPAEVERGGFLWIMKVSGKRKEEMIQFTI